MLMPGRFYKTKDKLFYVVSDGPMNNILIREIYTDLTVMDITVNRHSLTGAERLNPVWLDDLIEDDSEHISEFVNEMASTGWEPYVASLLELRLVKKALQRGEVPAYLAGQEEENFSGKLRSLIDQLCYKI